MVDVDHGHGDAALVADFHKVRLHLGPIQAAEPLQHVIVEHVSHGSGVVDGVDDGKVRLVQDILDLQQLVHLLLAPDELAVAVPMGVPHVHVGLPHVPADGTQVDVLHLRHIPPGSNDVAEQVIQHPHVVSVEVVEVAVGLVSGADVVLVLEPLGQLGLHRRVGAVLELHHPVVQAPAIHRHRRIVHEHNGVLVIHPLDSLPHFRSRNSNFVRDVLQIEHLGIVLIEGLGHVVGTKLCAVCADNPRFCKPNASGRIPILTHPRLMLVGTKGVVIV